MASQLATVDSGAAFLEAFCNRLPKTQKAYYNLCVSQTRELHFENLQNGELQFYYEKVLTLLKIVTWINSGMLRHNTYYVFLDSGSKTIRN